MRTNTTTRRTANKESENMKKDLNIRKGPGTNYDRVQFCPPGIYTIVTTSSGAGASLWGKLKSGIGWLSLDFCQRV